MELKSEAEELKRWHRYKLFLRGKPSPPFFSERQIWWVACGLNVGDEENGKGEKFVRPVLVVKKFNHNLFWGLPMTSRPKQGRYYLPIKASKGFESTLILSQLRAYDAKRLIDRVDSLDQTLFKRVRTLLKGFL